MKLVALHCTSLVLSTSLCTAALAASERLICETYMPFIRQVLTLQSAGGDLDASVNDFTVRFHNTNESLRSFVEPTVVYIYTSNSKNVNEIFAGCGFQIPVCRSLAPLIEQSIIFRDGNISQQRFIFLALAAFDQNSYQIEEFIAERIMGVFTAAPHHPTALK